MKPTETARVKKILLIRLRSIGDIILSGPALDALRAGFPSARITLVVDDVFADLVRGHPAVDRVLTFSRGKRGISKFVSDVALFLKVFGEGYDLTVDFHGGPKSVLLTLFSRASLRVGQRHRKRNRVYNLNEVPSEDPHSCDNGLKLTRALGLPDPAEPRFYVPLDPEAQRTVQMEFARRGIEEAEFRVMIHPGARVWFKRWPNENLYRVADRLREKYRAKILVAGNRLDRDELAGFQRRYREGVHLFSDPTLPELIALIHRCGLFIGNDSGPMHIAAALGIPTVALFGPSDPRIWGPLGPGPKKVFQAGGFDCMPCDQKHCVRPGDHCMLYIQPDEVLRGIEEILSLSPQPKTQPASPSPR
jgi:ADP-heptose:LPS heptosyltransferase